MARQVKDDGLTVVTSDDFRFVTGKLPGMPDIRVDTQALPATIQHQAVAYAVGVVMQREIAGMKKAGEPFARMHRRIDYRCAMLRMGQWSANESGLGRDFVDAIARLRKCDDVAAMQWLAGKSADAKRALRARPDVNLAMAEIAAERARAALGDDSADGLEALDSLD